MKSYAWQSLTEEEQRQVLARPVEASSISTRSKVEGLLERVRLEGLEALLAMTKEFDGVELQDLRVSAGEISAATEKISTTLLAALQQAKANVEKFHEKQIPQPYELETQVGVRCGREFRAIDAVGFYIPGGSAPLFSTVLMLAVPARLAGCRRMVLCTPPGRDGNVHPAILAACELSGVTEVFRVGGAQAIAAMAYGAGPVPSVNKIFGPGNSWVTEAKVQVAQKVPGLSIDMPAGPSEVLVIADDKANPEFVAWDLLSQAEHGPDSQAVLVSPSQALIDSVLALVKTFADESPRKVLLQEALKHLRAIKVEDLNEALLVSNAYGPEHLIVNTERPRELLAGIQSAGSVFLGSWTPESAGDYASGTNHVLPTSGYAKSTSGLGVNSFMKSMTVQEIQPEALSQLGPVVEEMAKEEGLQAHYQAMLVRRRSVEAK